MTSLFVANWKMHKGIKETADYVRILQNQTWPAQRQAVLCAPFTSLATIQELGASIQYGAQNMHWEEQGAFTGEIAATMLTELGCNYVLVGHSERRQYCGETDDIVNKKVRAALHNGLTPIICVGSTSENIQEVIATVTQQARLALAGLTEADQAKIVLAYEPIWAIGTGKTATPEHAQTIHVALRQIVGPLIPLLYGGSVTPDNATNLMAQSEVNGLLIGGASLNVEKFVQILNC